MIIQGFCDTPSRFRFACFLTGFSDNTAKAWKVKDFSALKRNKESMKIQKPFFMSKITFPPTKFMRAS